MHAETIERIARALIELPEVAAEVSRVGRAGKDGRSCREKYLEARGMVATGCEPGIMELLGAAIDEQRIWQHH